VAAEETAAPPSADQPSTIGSQVDVITARVAELKQRKEALTEAIASAKKQLGEIAVELEQGERMLKALTPRTVNRAPKATPAPATPPAFSPGTPPAKEG
jgi:hypothetical protein